VKAFLEFLASLVLNQYWVKHDFLIHIQLPSLPKVRELVLLAKLLDNWDACSLVSLVFGNEWNFKPHFLTLSFLLALSLR